MINAQNITAKDIAKWMLDELKKNGELYQADAAEHIESTFGRQYIYDNDNGNPAIDKKVLREFRKLTEGIVVWNRYDKYWRQKDKDDTSKGRLDE